MIIRHISILVIPSTLLFLCSQVRPKEIDSKQDLLQEESLSLPAEHRTYLSHGGSHSSGTQHGPYPLETSNEAWPVGRPDMPQIKALNVKCEKNHMRVNIEFDRPFFGMIFSKGHYSDPKCVHLPPGTGHLIVNFEIFLGSCGMTSSENSGKGGTALSGAGFVIEDTIIIQYDPQVQEIWDQARRLRCTWYDYYEKAVTFRPFNVDMLDAVTANFLGDNIQCWMQVQVGKGPWASEVSGIVKIGQTMTMVLAIKDDENKFDMMVRNCIAHDGKHQPIQLVDEYGCVVRPKIMSRFQKIKNFGHSATVVSYAYFQAFKFPDSMNVHFQCVIQVCRYECPEPSCEGELAGDYLPAPRDPSTSYTESKPSFSSPPKSGQQPPPPPPPSNSDKPQSSHNSGGYKKANNHGSPSHSQSRPQQHPPANKNQQGSGYPAVFYNRQGEQLPQKSDISVSGSYAISGTGGMPRSNEANSSTRRRRQAEQYKDIQTQRIIQVVAPGDVAFALPTGADNETTVDVYSTRTDEDGSAICMSLPGFAAGLVILLLLLIVSSLVAAFLYLRVRHLSLKDCQSAHSEKVINYAHQSIRKVHMPMGPH